MEYFVLPSHLLLEVCERASLKHKYATQTRHHQSTHGILPELSCSLGILTPGSHNHQELA